MDTPPPQPGPTHSSSTTNPITQTHHNRDQFLRHLTHLNKLSHKISKPTNRPAQPPLHLPHPPPPQQQQPPVYNISKSDFRDVVQKLTGSPSHAPPPAPTTIHAPKPNSSRLQRIRPPPLAQLTTRPPPLLNCSRNSGFGLGPMSPLPPLPSCYGAAESPISAYMRFLNSTPPENLENFPPPPQFTAGDSSSSVMQPPPLSPLSFGCLPSPKLLLPLSPTVPGVPSPK